MDKFLIKRKTMVVILIMVLTLTSVPFNVSASTICSACGMEKVSSGEHIIPAATKGLCNSLLLNTGSFQTALDKLIEIHPEHFSQHVKTDTKHCYNHVKEVCNAIFNVSGIPTYNSTGYKCTYDVKYWQELSVLTNPSAADVWNSLRETVPGDVIQWRVDSSVSSQHTLIVYSNDGNIVKLYQSTSQGSPYGKKNDSIIQQVLIENVTADNVGSTIGTFNKTGTGISFYHFKNNPDKGTGLRYYSSCGTVKIGTQTTLRAEPYEDADSLGSVSVGINADVLSLVKNKWNNLWYQVSVNGKIGYVFSGKISTFTPGNVSMTISGKNEPESEHKQNTTFSITGTIQASGGVLVNVHAEITGWSSATINVPLSSITNGAVSSYNSYNLYKSAVNTAMTFKALTPGNYTYVIRATVGVFYASNTQTIGLMSTSEKTLVSKNFNVVSSNIVSDVDAFNASKITVDHFLYVNSSDATMFVQPNGTQVASKTVNGASLSVLPEKYLVYADYRGTNANGDEYYHLINKKGRICDQVGDTYVQADKLTLADSGTYQVDPTTTAVLGIYTSNNTTSTKLTSITASTIVTVNSIVGEWANISYGSYTGYTWMGYYLYHPIYINGVRFDNNSLNLEINKSTRLTPIILPQNAITPQEYAWGTSDDSIVSVNEDGVITGLMPGTATVSFLIEEGGFVASCTVTVFCNHTAVTAPAVAATCTASGLSAGSHCSVCGGVITARQTIPATGHNYGAPVWTWNGYTAATAKFTCTNDSSHVQNVSASITSNVTVQLTCTSAGTKVYTATVSFNGTTYTDTKTETLAATGHNYGTPVYTWSDDYTTVTASRICANSQDHVETETVNTVSQVTKPATVEANGETTYTAVFANAAFSTQTKVVANIPALQPEIVPEQGSRRIIINDFREYTVSVDGVEDYYTSEIILDLAFDSHVVLTADDTANFGYWRNSANVIVSRTPVFELDVTVAETYTAVYNTKARDKVTVIFESLFDQVISRIQVSLAGIDTLVMPAGPSRYGYTFTGWQYDANELRTLAAAALESADVSDDIIIVKPEYVKKAETKTITVTGGSGTGTYDADASVTIVANQAPAGQKFSHWINGSGTIVSYRPDFTFYVMTDEQYTAIFVDANAAVTPTGIATISSIVKDTDNRKISFASFANVPDGFTIKNAGVIATSDGAVGSDSSLFTTENAAYVRGSASANTASRFVWTKGNVGSETWYVRAFITYSDTQGNTFTILGDIVSASLSLDDFQIED